MARARREPSDRWTGLVAKTIQLYGLLDPKTVLKGGNCRRLRQSAGNVGKA
jgi:hypothetical protein